MAIIQNPKWDTTQSFPKSFLTTELKQNVFHTICDLGQTPERTGKTQELALQSNLWQILWQSFLLPNSSQLCLNLWQNGEGGGLRGKDWGRKEKVKINAVNENSK